MYYNRNRYTRPVRCMNCGRAIDSETSREYEGYCGSGCVEEEVDRRIMEKQDRRGW